MTDMAKLFRGFFLPAASKSAVKAGGGVDRVPERLHIVRSEPTPATITHSTSGVRRRVRRTKP